QGMLRTATAAVDSSLVPVDSTCSSLLVATQAELQPRPKGQRKPRIADWANVLVVEQIVELREEQRVMRERIGHAKIELHVAEVKIAIAQQQRIRVVDVLPIQIGGVVA